MRALVFLWLMTGEVAAPSSASADAGARLSPSECSVLLDAMMSMSVSEALSSDPDVKAMSTDLRAATASAAKKQALEDPKLQELKAACPSRYTPRQRDCILGAKTMREVDACAKN